MRDDDAVKIVLSVFKSKRRVAILGVSIASVLAVAGGGLAAAGAFNHSAVKPLSMQSTSAAQSMANVFAAPAATAVPDSVNSEVTALVAGVPSGTPGAPGHVLLDQGRTLLSNLGPEGGGIYAYPTDDGQVCYVMTGGLGEGCMQAFLVGEPATVSGGSAYDPPQSGPPTELAGFTQDNVTGVQVIVNGTPHDAVFGNDAWYYRFSDNQTPGTAATALLVTLNDGSTVTVPTRMSAPSQQPTAGSSG